MQEDAMKVLANARIFDGRSMLPGAHDVTLDGKRIASVNPHAGAAPDAVDLSGMTLMPGLLSCHTHPPFFTFQLCSGYSPGKESRPRVMLVTRIRTLRGAADTAFRA